MVQHILKKSNFFPHLVEKNCFLVHIKLLIIHALLQFLIELLQYIKCRLAVFLIRGKKSLRIVILLIYRCSSGAAEIIQNPRRHSLNIRNVPDGFNLLRLTLLGSLIGDRTMQSDIGVRSEFRNNYRLLRLTVCKKCRQCLQICGVPATIFI